MNTPIWDAAFEAARDRIGDNRYWRYRRNRPYWANFLIAHPVIALAFYEESLTTWSVDETDKNNLWMNILLNNADLAQAIYLEALTHQQKDSSNDDAKSDPSVS